MHVFMSMHVVDRCFLLRCVALDCVVLIWIALRWFALLSLHCMAQVLRSFGAMLQYKLAQMVDFFKAQVTTALEHCALV